MDLLIGSRALNFWYPDCKIKEDADWDIISSAEIQGAEWHQLDILNNAGMLAYASNQFIQFNGRSVNVCNTTGLAIIKRSHLHRSLSFGKHITHWIKWLSARTDAFTANDWKVLAERTELTKQQYPQGNPNLMQPVKDFFDDAVSKIYEHDYLHELVAYYDKPLYTKLQRNPKLAWCDKELWDKLTHEDKCKCVAEECYVIAIERFISKDWNYSFKLAYNKSLEKVCTTLCSGYFRDFAIDNFAEILQLFNAEKIHAVKSILLKENVNE